MKVVLLVIMMILATVVEIILLKFRHFGVTLALGMTF